MAGYTQKKNQLHTSVHSWDKKHYEVENHPYADFIPKNVKYLIIGTFPAYQKNAQFPFYYSGERNHFWGLLASIFNHSFNHFKGKNAVEERKQLLERQNIGITDMLLSCYRYQAGSGDDQIFPIAIKDIFQLLDRHTSIERLIFTSRTHIIGALGLFVTYLHQHGQELEQLQVDELKIMTGKLLYKGRTIEIKVPYSPSARLNIGLDSLLPIYTRCLR